MTGPTHGGAGTGPARSSPVLAIIRLFLVTTISGFMASGLIGVRYCRGPHPARTARWTRRWSRLCLRALGIAIRVRGPRPPAGALITPNHTGYGDVVALGSVLPCVFVAKAELLQVPLVSNLLHAAGQISIVRSHWASLITAREHISALLASRTGVCVFLEADSSAGEGLLPFRPALLQAAIDEQAWVVPVGLRWRSHQSGVVVGEDIAFWREEHQLLPHLWRFAGLRGTMVEVCFATPIPAVGERMALSDTIRSAIWSMLRQRNIVGAR